MTKTLSELPKGIAIFVSLLDDAIAQAGIKPIPNETIEKYMQEQLDAAPPSNALGRFLDRFGIADSVFNRWGPLVGLVLFVAGGFGSMVGVLQSLLILAAPSTVAVCIGLVGLCLCALSSVGIGPARWHTMSFKTTDDVHPLALEYVARIRAQNNHVRFEVADLLQNRYSLDPVLFAVLGDDRVPLLVWEGNKIISF